MSFDVEASDFIQLRVHSADVFFVLGWARPFLIPDYLFVCYSGHLNKAIPTSGEFTLSENLTAFL